MTSRVIVYGYEGCRYCSQAKFLLEHHGVNYEYKDVKKNADARTEFKALSDPSPATVPQITIDGKNLGGFDALVDHLEEPANIAALL